MILMLPIEDDQKRRELWKQNCTDTQIAEICGVSRTTIYSWRIKNDLKSNSKRKGRCLDKNEQLFRHDLFDKGHTDEEMAEILNISKMTVVQWRTKNGLNRTQQTNNIKYQNLNENELIFHEYLKNKHPDLRETTLLALAKFVEPKSDMYPGANLRRYARRIKATGFKTVFYFDDGEFSCINEAVKLFVQINRDTICNTSKNKLGNSIPSEYYALVCEEINK